MKPELLVHRGYFYTPYITIWNAGVMVFAHIKYATTSSISKCKQTTLVWYSGSVASDTEALVMTSGGNVDVNELRRRASLCFRLLSKDFCLSVRWLEVKQEKHKSSINHFLSLRLKMRLQREKYFVILKQPSKTPSTHFQKDEDTFLITSCEVSSLQKRYSC